MQILVEEIFLAGDNVVIEGKYHSCKKNIEEKGHIEANKYRKSLTKDSFIGNGVCVCVCDEKLSLRSTPQKFLP